MHNLLPIRGAKVRDALKWSNYMEDALNQAQGMEVYIGSHNWPLWGNAEIKKFLTMHRDVYKYTHDQTVRLMNAGYTPREIADKIKLPESLQSYFGVRGYYGDLRHNVKAVYQFYLGAYDGNPANLNPLAPVDSAKRYLELLGGTAKAISAAQIAFDKGDYRWAAELLNHAVMGDSGSKEAKELLAKTYEQMGYMAESATWRNSYLTAALDLRNGPPSKGASKLAFIDVLLQTPVDRFLEAMAASLNGPDAESKDMTINLELTDLKESYVLSIENAVLHFKKSAPASGANATLKLTKTLFVKMMIGAVGIKEMLLSDELKVEGSKIDLARFFGLIDKAPGNFQIVTRQ
jgi:alkyl sulfatase BDS1-like metallo-beta-lactamase superfamily hydrolase